MSYATQSDLENILPQQDLISLTDDDNTGWINSAMVDNALEPRRSLSTVIWRQSCLLPVHRRS